MSIGRGGKVKGKGARMAREDCEGMGPQSCVLVLQAQVGLCGGHSWLGTMKAACCVRRCATLYSFNGIQKPPPFC